MKINFWQILGGILLLLGVIGICYREFGGGKSPATQPTTTPTLPIATASLPIATQALPTAA